MTISAGFQAFMREEVVRVNRDMLVSHQSQKPQVGRVLLEHLQQITHLSYPIYFLSPLPTLHFYFW
jgi:hypothetical protein